MDSHTFKVLEFDKVLRLLAKHITSDPGLKALEKLSPSSDSREIALRQAETSEMKEILKLDPSFCLAAVKDLSIIFSQISPQGAILSPLEIWSVEELLLESHRLKNYFQSRHKLFPMLHKKSDKLNSLPELSSKIRQTVSSQGTILDEASWRLNSIRQRLKTVRWQVKDQLENLLHSHFSVVQDPIITLRHNRYVIPLKPEFKRRLSGIIHDQSASGATLFVEPGEIIELNNRLIRLELNEQEEIRQILLVLTGQIKENRDCIDRNQETFADLDLILAKAGFSQEFNGCEPELSVSNSLCIRKGRHPLLLARNQLKDESAGNRSAPPHPDPLPPGERELISRRQCLLPPCGEGLRWGGELLQSAEEPVDIHSEKGVIPLDLEIGDRYRTLLITGPNAGGKTVAIKTIGLLALMFQAGMQIPVAEGSKLPVFKGIFADIGDEQSIEQDLSTFSAHMKNLSHIVNAADKDSLILLDELGAGTDPEEGAALGISILKYLHHKGGLTVATTHHNALKHFVFMQDAMENASVEYDSVTLRPTFRLLIGQVGRSNALAVAAQAGLEGEIISAAQDELGDSAGKIESLIGILQETTKRMEEKFRALDAEKDRMENLREHQALILQDLKNEKRLLRRDFEREKRLFFAEAQKRIRESISQIREKASESDEVKPPKEILKEYNIKMLTSLAEVENESRSEEQAAIKLGDQVKVENLKLVGTVIEDTGNEERVVVEVGTRRLNVPRQHLKIVSLTPPEGGMGKNVQSRPVYLLERTKEPNLLTELNVIGQTVEEARTKVENFLDEAVLQELPGIRIIHGRGTGKLREGIWEMLKGHPLVKSVRFEDLRRGGTAVTIVDL